MANEITTTAYDDVTHPSLVEPVMIAALAEQPGLWALSREFNLIGKPTAAAKIPKEVSWWGSADDDGAGVDAELNGTEGTHAGNTASATSSGESPARTRAAPSHPPRCAATAFATPAMHNHRPSRR